jgi:hypothetical protein
MMIITCKTVQCPMGDEKHTPHPDGIMVVCCFCGLEMTEFVETTQPEIVVQKVVVDEPVVEEVIDHE